MRIEELQWQLSRCQKRHTVDCGKLVAWLDEWHVARQKIQLLRIARIEKLRRLQTNLIRKASDDTLHGVGRVVGQDGGLCADWNQLAIWQHQEVPTGVLWQYVEGHLGLQLRTVEEGGGLRDEVHCSSVGTLQVRVVGHKDVGLWSDKAGGIWRHDLSLWRQHVA